MFYRVRVCCTLVVSTIAIDVPLVGHWNAKDAHKPYTFCTNSAKDSSLRMQLYW